MQSGGFIHPTDRNIKILESLKNHEEFINETPPLMPELPSQRLPSDDGYTYEEWINALARNVTFVKSAKIWEFSQDGEFKGFGPGGRKIFRTMAHKIRSYHLSSYFCGDLYHRVHISMSPELHISFPFAPVKDDSRLEDGVTNDMVHFRYMVAFLIKATLKIRLENLPDEFLYFFSRLFTSFIKNRKEACFYVVFHPIFFNSYDRVDFIHAFINFRGQAAPGWNPEFHLHHPDYELRNWQQKFTEDDIFSVILDYDDYDYTFAASLPYFLRNLYHHYADDLEDEQKETQYQPRELLEKHLNSIFPGICSKILDAVVRADYSFRCFSGKFFMTLEDATRGFHSEAYSPSAFV